MHVLFLIALNEHTEHLLPFARIVNQDHDAIIRDAIFCLYGILSRLKRPVSLASCIPRWHPESIMPAPSSQPQATGVFLGADALLRRCEGVYRGSIWGLIVSGNTNHDYEITEGSWNLLGWLVEVWRRDSEDEKSKVDSGTQFSQCSPAGMRSGMLKENKTSRHLDNACIAIGSGCDALLPNDHP